MTCAEGFAWTWCLRFGSALVKALQAALPEPFLHLSSDHLVASGILPSRRAPDGPFAWWAQMRPRFFAGFRRCLPASRPQVPDHIAFGLQARHPATNMFRQDVDHTHGWRKFSRI